MGAGGQEGAGGAGQRFGSPGSRWGRGGQRLQHGTARPHSCHSSWGNKPLETPSAGGSRDIVSDPITPHPFLEPWQQLSLPFSGSTFHGPSLRFGDSPLGPTVPGRRRGTGHRARHRANSLQTFGMNFPLSHHANWQLGAVLNTGTHRALPKPPTGSRGDHPGHISRLISQRFPGCSQPDLPEVAQPALNGSGFNVGGRWAPHKGPSPLQAGLSPCLIKS